MQELRDLYQEVIFDHNRHPSNFGKLADANRHAEGFNPLCGDQLNLYLKVDSEGVITDIQFDGHGCAISTASASIMTETVKGKTVAEAEILFQAFHSMAIGELEIDNSPVLAGKDKLKVLSGVRDFPARVKCATLAWHTLHGALSQTDEAVTTE